MYIYHGRDKWERGSSVLSIVSSFYRFYGSSVIFKKALVLTWGLDSQAAQNQLAGYMLPVHNRLDAPALGYFLSFAQRLSTLTDFQVIQHVLKVF
jgi:hypothetical protein